MVYAYSPEIDSIESFLQQHTQSDSVRVNSLLTFSEKVLVFDLNVSGKAANEAFGIAQKISYSKGEVLAKAYIGKYYWHKGDVENALKYGLGVLEELEKLRAYSGLAMTYKYLAFLYDQEGNTAEARQFMGKVLTLAKQQHDQKRERNTYLDLAALYQLKAPDSAKAYYQLAKKLDQVLGDAEGIAWTNYSMGTFLISQNQFEEAKNLLTQASTTLEARGNNMGTAACYRSLGYLYRLLEEHDKSSLYLKKSIAILEKLGAMSQLQESYEQLYFTQKEKGDLYHALESHEMLLAIKDSLMSRKKSRQVVEMQAKHEVDQKVKENELLVAQQQKQNLILITVIIALALISVLAFVLYQYNRIYAKTNKTLQLLNKEIELKNEQIVEKNEEIKLTNQNLNGMIVERTKQWERQKQLNEEIEQKNKQITEQAQEIERTNQRLEELVQERTQKLQDQNEKLKNYAFHNSHKIRGPLARILGLIDAYRANYISDPSFVFHHVEVSAHEMDAVVRDINDILAADPDAEAVELK
ncbi:MAG: tetratricopeptide repeat protein [Bacteroidia bacterium]